MVGGVIGQPMPDRMLRIVVVGYSRGLVASDHAVAYDEGSQCLSGSPVPMTGAMTTGMPAIRLGPVY